MIKRFIFSQKNRDTEQQDYHPARAYFLDAIRKKPRYSETFPYTNKHETQRSTDDGLYRPAELTRFRTIRADGYSNVSINFEQFIIRYF